jgi:hypothetical protein
MRLDRSGIYADGSLADPDLDDGPGTTQANDSGLGDVEEMRGLIARQQRRAQQRGYTTTSLRISLATVVPDRS